MIEELLTAFAKHGPDTGADEIADILWLAARVDAAARPSPTEVSRFQGDEDYDTTPQPAWPDLPATHASKAQLFRTSRPAGTDLERGDTRRGVPLRLPRAAVLHDPLALMRALRPIGRRSIGGSGEQLDEQATVERSVEQGLPCPVLLPADSRWLDLALVVDMHHSMLLWTDLVEELRHVLTGSGIFRDVRTWYLSGVEPGRTPMVATRWGAVPRDPAEIVDPAGHRMILVITDTVAAGWSGGALHDVLGHWSGHNAVAVVNVLPERLWSRAAAQPSSLSLSSDRPARATGAWRRVAAFRRSRPGRRRAEAAAQAFTAVPMISTSARSLSRLARVVSGDASWQRMACLLLDSRPADDTVATDPDTVFDDLKAVELFRAGASPTAQRLAAYLAAVPLTLPVMTLVRRSLLPESEHGHLAEVALGGLFKPWGTIDADVPPDVLSFDFRPGVRDALLGSQLRGEVAAVHELVRQSVWDYIVRNPDGRREFSATRVSQAEADGRRRVGAEEQPFAEHLAISTADETHQPPAIGSALSERLVRVSPPAGARGTTSLGLLLTPRLVLTCLNRPASTQPDRVVYVSTDGRSVEAQVVWRQGQTPCAALVMAGENVLDTETWAQRIPTRLEWGTLDSEAATAVRIDAFSEVGASVTLGGQARQRTRDHLEVTITEPHPTTGWPQLAGAPLSQRGVFTGLIVRRDAQEELTAVSARALLADGGLRGVLEGHMRTPYKLVEAEGGNVEPVANTRAQTHLYLAFEIKRYARTLSHAEPVRREREFADLLVAVMQSVAVDGTVIESGRRGSPDLLLRLDQPLELGGLGRLLLGLWDSLSTDNAQTGASLIAGIAVTEGESRAASEPYMEKAVQEATLMASDPAFVARLRRLQQTDAGPLLLALSPDAHTRIISALDRSSARQFVPFESGESGRRLGWFCNDSPRNLGLALEDAEAAEQQAAYTAAPWVSCGVETPDSDNGQCVGRALPGYTRCLAHLSSEDRAGYLATLGPGASIDFSGTEFTAALLDELFTVLRDPEGGYACFGDAVFEQTRFQEDCDFRGVKFTRRVSFNRARFLGVTHFEGASFASELVMDYAAFHRPVFFDKALFRAEATWNYGHFNADARWAQALFLGTASFAYAHFSRSALYDHADFESTLSFDQVSCSGELRFRQAVFRERVSLCYLHASGLVDFSGALIDQGIDFSYAVLTSESPTLTLPAGWHAEHDSETQTYAVRRSPQSPPTVVDPELPHEEDG